jgi:hypothetical protein
VGGEEKYTQGFGGERDLMEDLCVDGSIILKFITMK